MNVVTDEYIEHLFAGCNFGEMVNSSTEAKRDFLRYSLENQLKGYWCGSNIYAIMTTGGFLVDSKHGSVKRLTALGVAFLDGCPHQFKEVRIPIRNNNPPVTCNEPPKLDEIHYQTVYQCTLCGKTQ